MTFELREKCIDLLMGVGKSLLSKDDIRSFELINSHDVHAYYRIFKGGYTKAVHVQAYPGMSEEKQARVYARLMDYERMLDIRRVRVSDGNEHDAVISPFPNFESGVYIPYDPKVLEEMIKENIS